MKSVSNLSCAAIQPQAETAAPFPSRAGGPSASNNGVELTG